MFFLLCIFPCLYHLLSASLKNKLEKGMKKFTVKNSFMKNILVASLMIVSLKVFSQSDSIPSFVKDSLDSYVNRALTDWPIPGVAVCVVKNGKVVIMKGYGVKDYDTNQK